MSEDLSNERLRSFLFRLRLARMLASFSNDFPGLRRVRRKLLRWALRNPTIKVSSHVRFDRSHPELGGRLYFGEDVEVGPNVSIDLSGGVSVGDGVTLSERSQILSHNHNYKNRSVGWRTQGLVSQPIAIGEDVWIGSGALILGSAQVVGKGAIVAAASVVTKPVPEYSVVAGVPARIVGRREEDADQEAEMVIPGCD